MNRNVCKISREKKKKISRILVNRKAVIVPNVRYLVKSLAGYPVKSVSSATLDNV